MPLYTFYPCKADGTAETFVCFDFQNDGEAYVRALQLLDQHASAVHIAVWSGERKVATRGRMHKDLRTVLGQRSQAE